ncbi:LOW QUALITY PROTEIN: centromere protein J [Phyllopteryx taeniolatus]|uniref:LOW QUALITY PROTEIN: centromere protein J n=1 Tax=Phyllopteryx taeniolatus TaxID=161469 RepID=UPI002AD55185|nr:LOW QUALITY PROTEIN: centromere protein J [Phyllopteryx taeniolatus]
MSSPTAGLPYSPSDFLARWMPSSSRAGVILGPGSLQCDSPVASVPPEPDDFAPMAASVDSSCVGMESLSVAAGGDVSQEVSVMMKLDQLRRWQQHLEEQLKADQLDELRRLQEEQRSILAPSSPGQSLSSHPCGLQKEHRQKEEALMRLQSGQNGIERHDEGEDLRHDGFPKLTANNHNIHNNNRNHDPMLQDRPIQASKQTYEELLEEHLRLEEQRLKSAQQQQNPDGGQLAAPPKRAFLRRGKGLSRYTNKASVPKEDSNTDPKTSSQALVVAHSNSELTCIQKSAAKRLPVQRKTATLNKENSPRDKKDRRVEIKASGTKVLGCYQRQNTGGQVNTNKLVEESQPATKQAGVQAASPEVSRELLEKAEKLQHPECEHHLEIIELGEFELLEQMAEELSFSSNSSFVTKVLQMDCEKRKLLGVAGLHQRRLSSTPIKSPLAREQRCIPEINGGAVKSHDEEEENSSSEAAADDFKGPERAVTPPVFPISLCFPVPSEPPYDKRSYQDDDCESDIVVSSIEDDNSTLEDNKDVTAGRVMFADDNTWNDMDDTAVSAEPVSTETANQEPDAAPIPAPPPPPSSKLMMKLVPVLKPKTPNAPLPPPDFSSIYTPDKVDDKTGQQVQSTQLRERLVELELEIERFKKENAALAKLRQENEKNQENLRKERLAWEQQQAEQMAHFEEYKKEETRKLQRERKLFEKHATAARAVPDKKEREEIQALKQQLSSMQEDLRKKESRWSATHNRLRQQIDSLGQENNELRDEVRILEKLRLSVLKNSFDSEKDVKNVPPVIKGVTFANPLDSSGSASPPQGTTAAPISGNTIAHASKGMKSSLRKPTSSSSSLRRQMSEEKQMAATEKSPNEQCSESCSPILRESNEAESTKTESVQEVITHPDGKVEKVLASGNRVFVFPNGTTKEVSCDGVAVKFKFFNGDIKEVMADHRVLYYYADTRATQITYPDGMEVLHFPDNQMEKLFPDGRKEITFADQTVKTFFPDGSEESVLTDGTVVQLKTDGTQEIHFNTGHKEVHTADYKSREYPDGTVKTIYADGRQETRYPGGWLRIKDKHGNLLTEALPWTGHK